MYFNLLPHFVSFVDLELIHMDDSPSLAVPKALEHGCAAVQVGGIERTVTPMRYRRKKRY